MLPAAIAEQLRGRGHDATAVTERRQLRGLPDADLFELAQGEQRAVVTYDRDFLVLDRQYRGTGRGHNGLVILHPRRFPIGPAGIGRVVVALDALAERGAPYPSFVHWLQSRAN